MRAHTRSEQEWVSYEPKGNKVECPLRSNGDQGYLCDSHTRKMEAHIFDIHTKVMEAQRIFA